MIDFKYKIKKRLQFLIFKFTKIENEELYVFIKEQV
jgi:hypothetical protein